MTRVNVVPVIELYDQHLMAEYREIPMVMGSLHRSLDSNSIQGKAWRLIIPPTYRMGPGHVSFFYNKGEWLFKRFCKVTAELQLRGFNVQPELRRLGWDVFHKHDLWFTEWKPNKLDKAINRKRIAARVAEKPDWYRMTAHGDVT